MQKSQNPLKTEKFFDSDFIQTGIPNFNCKFFEKSLKDMKEEKFLKSHIRINSCIRILFILNWYKLSHVLKKKYKKTGLMRNELKLKMIFFHVGRKVGRI